MTKEPTGHAPSFWQGVAVTCFVFAFLAAAAGSLLTTTWIFNGQLHPGLHALGLILLMLALPIVILGGHCLDLRDHSSNRFSRSW